jgi:hypothetical protein
MTLTPTLKFLIIAFALAVNVVLLTWTGIKIDVLALGMREEVFNIGLTVLTMLNAGAGALLVYLGLKAPTVGDKEPTS